MTAADSQTAASRFRAQFCFRNPLRMNSKCRQPCLMDTFRWLPPKMLSPRKLVLMLGMTSSAFIIKIHMNLDLSNPTTVDLNTHLHSNIY